MDLEASYRARADEVNAYGSSWWARRDQPQAAFLDANTGLRLTLMRRVLAGGLVESKHVYSTGDGSWDSGRVGTQLGILDRLDAACEGLAATTSDAVYFLIGLPGSGKTTALRPLVTRHVGVGGVPVSDADEVRVQFPEYNNGLGSEVLQTETALVTYGHPPLWGRGRQQRVLEQGGVAVVDVIGSAEHLPRTVNALAAEGRSCFILMTRCPVEECRRRVMHRAVTSGRFVPVDLVDAKAGAPEEALHAALDTGSVTGWAVVDTTFDPVEIVAGDGTFTGAHVTRPPSARLLDPLS